ncbi:polysaccharide lyase family 14 protein [Amanita thiersii Skay4041]|uniref:Polysaccharide lyase family 14 protein n=1 Tax=Amanita thiersii Skay4041 TaxID=703135 RepID=A0A2A9NTZ4_9AGAR|nr:polysaccharide lyase family 14 protein [Amanita thiersii Skay4041]
MPLRPCLTLLLPLPGLLAFPVADADSPGRTVVMNPASPTTPSITSTSPSFSAISNNVFTNTLSISTSTASFTSSATSSAQSAAETTPIRQWRTPSQFSDLRAFNISKFPVGRQNLEIVNGLPDAAYTTEASDEWVENENDSLIQILYPAYSTSPSKRPQGGAEFYASPLDITNAHNVSLGYSVFFPADFDWVLAGKMPGLYGGHTGCSGGNVAKDCFSTRLMWRKGGIGELYLYAPKDKQTKAMCSDPQSVCDMTYGFSVGRGSFRWAAGGWTTVTQTVGLNTPGMQDGTFTLDVNGSRVIDRHDIFYRNAPPFVLADPPREDEKMSASSDSGSCEQDGEESSIPLFKTFLRQLWDGYFSPAWVYQDSKVEKCNRQGGLPNTDKYVSSRDIIIPIIITLSSPPPPPTPPSPSSTIARKTASPPTSTSRFPSEPLEIDYLYPPTGFVGLFFSTFFGGNGAQYATPRDQLTWFKDFQITYNS